MAYVELVAKRKPKTKVFQDDVDPTKHRSVCTTAPIHYAGTVDGVIDTEINFDVSRIDNAQLDGWQATGGDFHYILGIPQGKTGDGWLGFGGRQGEHWILMKLRGIGYLHKPARAWQGVGGNPTYDRGNLTQVKKRVTIQGQEIILATTATWTGIWTTPGGGSVDLIIRADPNKLRVDVALNQIGREWIAANAPPTTPAGQTWFGLAFEMDYVDVPKLKQDGVEVDPDDDFNDDGDEVLTFETAIDQVLGIMPIDSVTVPGTGVADQRETARLNKRFWKDTDTQFNGGNYLFTGAKVGVLNGMRTGPFLFDPSITPVSPGVGADDCDQTGGAFRINGYYGPNHDTFGNIGFSFKSGFRFDAIGLEQGATITNATITITRANWAGSPELLIYVEDTQDPDVWDNSSGNRPADTISGATIAGITFDPGTDPGSDAEFVTPDIKAAIQPLVDDGAWDTDHAIRVAIDDDAGATNFAATYDWNHASGPGTVLEIDYTAAGGGGAVLRSPVQHHHHLLRR